MKRYGQHATKGFLEAVENAFILWKAKYDYYELASPSMSDAEFDELEREVKLWEQENQVWLAYTPTQQVGYSKENMIGFCRRYGFSMEEFGIKDLVPGGLIR